MAEVDIFFVILFLDCFADAWVEIEERLVVDADEGRAGVHLSVFRTVGYVSKLFPLRGAELLDNLSGREVLNKKLALVARIREDELRLATVQDGV